LRITAKIRLGLAAACVVLGLVACSKLPLVYELELSPQTITPNADGDSDVTRIVYHVSRPATVSLWLVDEAGGTHMLRDAVWRPPGEYEILFSGVIGNRLLPDGAYVLRLEASSRENEAFQAETLLHITEGQQDHIEIRNLSIYPPGFTPNRDGISDRVTIGYYLTKEAEKVQVYLLDDQGNKYAVPEDKIRPAGQVGNHEHDYDAGVDLGAAPPRDGPYTVVVEAEDATGNRDVARGELTIDRGGVPIAEIVNRAATWSSDVVPLGGTLSFTCTVRNIGKVGIRTKGPEPGVQYTTSENFNTKEFFEEPGIFRVGLDFEGNSAGRVYPFRWQLGQDAELTVIDGQRYLMPGQVVTVSGHLQISDRPALVAPYYWLGLIHEQVEIVEDRVDPIPVSIGF